MLVPTHMAGSQMDGEAGSVHRNRDVTAPSMTCVDPRLQSETTHKSHTSVVILLYSSEITVSHSDFKT